MAIAFLEQTVCVNSKLKMAEKTAEMEFQVGPLSILQHAVTNRTQIMVSCRNNKKLLGHLKAFDRHTNLVMENVREMWTELPRKGKGQKTVVNKDRFVSKMFLRGDSIILVAKNPLNKKSNM